MALGLVVGRRDRDGGGLMPIQTTTQARAGAGRQATDPITPQAGVDTGGQVDLAVLLAQRDMAAARLAAADADAFRAEGPRIDGRIGTLLSLLLGALAASSAVGGVGAVLSRQHHAYLALWLLAGSAVVLVTGLALIMRLILPRLTPVAPRAGRLARITVRIITRVLPCRRRPRRGGGALAQVAALPDLAAARAHYQAAAGDCLGYQSALAYQHAVAITRRFYRFRTAGWVLTAGVVLAAAGFLALGWGW